MDYFENIVNCIGNTPLIKLNSIVKDLPCTVLAKYETFNPGNSVKDRIGLKMILDAEKKGNIKPGGTIIEGTSGNTGMGLAIVAINRGYKCIFVTSDKQSKGKLDVLRAFGAEVIVCPTNVDPEDERSYYSVSKRLSEEIPNSWYVNQYDNPSNTLAHYESTGPEIWNQTNGKITHFVVGVGTGGTISGCSRYLKSKMPNLKTVGVDCEGSILMHYHKTGEICEAKSYVVEGIGEDFLPDNVLFDQIDDFVMVNDKESFLMTRELLTKEGIYAGGSCGSAVVGAIRYAETLDKPERILVILPDSGNRYASKIYNDKWMRKMGYFKDEISKDELDLQIDKILG